MTRRGLLLLLPTMLLLYPALARSREPTRIYRLGPLSPLPRNTPPYVALFDALKRLGFVEGQNLTVDMRGYGLRDDQFLAVAQELAAARVDVILATGDAAVRAAQEATATIPILGSTDDMVGSGLVRSMAHPGGNTTGTSILSAELDGKRQEILTEIVPDARRIAALADAETTPPRRLDALREAAHQHGIELLIYGVAKREDIAPAIDAATAAGAGALNVLASPFLRGNEREIRERTAALSLPAMYQFPEMAEAGGLAGYGPRIDELYRTAYAQQLVRLLEGAKPSDLPVQQPAKFELVINLKTAKALGLTVPQALLARADEVIE